MSDGSNLTHQSPCLTIFNRITAVLGLQVRPLLPAEVAKESNDCVSLQENNTITLPQRLYMGPHLLFIGLLLSGSQISSDSYADAMYFSKKQHHSAHDNVCPA